jgi:hypothetical protein
LAALVRVEAREQVGLGFVGVELDLLEVARAGPVDGDEVATPVVGVGLTIDVAAGLEPGHDAADVVAVQAEPPAEIGLAERAVLVERGEDGEVGACRS